MPDFFFFFFSIHEPINYTAKKVFPSSLVLAHWNSEKYADVGCFAGKVDKGQMWLFLCFLCLGGLQTDIWRKEEFPSLLSTKHLSQEKCNSPGYFSVEE